MPWRSITTTDEESRNLCPRRRHPRRDDTGAGSQPSEFTYRLVDGDGSRDNIYFDIDNNGLLSFKDSAPAETYLKRLTDSDRTYSVRIEVTDHGTGDGNAGDRAPKTRIEIFTFEVRDFDIDWAAENYVAHDRAIDLRERGAFAVDVRDTRATEAATPEADADTHVVTILPSRGFNPAGATWLANNADWGGQVNAFRAAIREEGRRLRRHLRHLHRRAGRRRTTSP